MLSCLVEGNSIRSTERLTHVHRDTIMRLLVQVGEQCLNLLDRHMRGFHSRLIQVDEIWTFCKKKQARLTEWEQRDPELGDQYVFVAIDAKTKLIPTFTVGKRDGQTALAFMEDLSRRLEQNGRIQLTSDGFNAYIGAVEDAFGGEVDYAQLVKVFGAEDPGRGRYSPP